MYLVSYNFMGRNVREVFTTAKEALQYARKVSKRADQGNAWAHSPDHIRSWGSFKYKYGEYNHGFWAHRCQANGFIGRNHKVMPKLPSEYFEV